MRDFAKGKSVLCTKSIGVVVPSISRRIAFINCEAECMKHQNKGVGIPFRHRFPSNEVSNRTGPETAGSRGSSYRRKGRTNAMFRRAHGSDRPLPFRSKRHLHLSEQYETTHGP